MRQLEADAITCCLINTLFTLNYLLNDDVQLIKELGLQFVDDEASAILLRKKSRFISYLFPYQNFEAAQKKLKQQHPKARHFVYAYRYLDEREQLVENSGDDGEPRGTSGKPSLAVLSGCNAINTAVITVRYFGGIKLGTGGLVKAYSDAVNAVCDVASFQSYQKLGQQTLTVSHKKLPALFYQLKRHNIEILNKKFGVDVVLTLEATVEQFEELGDSSM